MLNALDASDTIALRARLRRAFAGTRPSHEADERVAGLSVGAGTQIKHLLPPVLTPAAVLIPIVERPAGLSVLFTERAIDLRHHAGQISFPGGRLEPDEADPVTAALREAFEEIGLAEEQVEVLGCLPNHLIFTGYRVTPVVGLVVPPNAFRLDAAEVASVFEVPFAHLLNADHYQVRARTLGGNTVQVYEIAFQQHTIWGATAGMVRNLCEVLAATGRVP